VHQTTQKRDLYSAITGALGWIVNPILDAITDEFADPLGPDRTPRNYDDMVEYREPPTAACFGYANDSGEHDVDHEEVEREYFNDPYTPDQYLRDIADMDDRRDYVARKYADQIRDGSWVMNAGSIPVQDWDALVDMEYADDTPPFPKEDEDEDGDTVLEPTPLLPPEQLPVVEPAPPEYGDPVGG